jgi:hypothetical protein
MPVLAPVYVQNNQPGPTVLATDPKGTVVVEWAGKDDPTGNDIQPIPEEMLNHPAFTKALSRGILSLMEDMSDPSIVEALQRQTDSWNARTQRAAVAATSAIDHVASNDFIQMDCIGPNTRGQGLCGNPVSVREKQKEAAPALCEVHKDLSAEFVPESRFEGDETHTRWIRTVMSPRQIGEQS